MPCTSNFNMAKVPVLPEDPKAIKALMEGYNRLVDTLFWLLNGGQPVLIHSPGDADDGHPVRDAADNRNIVRVPDVQLQNMGIFVGNQEVGVGSGTGTPKVGIVQATSQGGRQTTVFGETVNTTTVVVKEGDLYGDTTYGDEITVHIADDGDQVNLRAGDVIMFEEVTGAGADGGALYMASTYLSMPMALAHVHTGTLSYAYDYIGGVAAASGAKVCNTGPASAGVQHTHTLSLDVGEYWDANYSSSEGEAT
jgi:hypothetical protein